MNEYAEKYATSVQFIFVYILEAHANDEWRVDSINTEVSQHKNLSDRADAAQKFIEKFPLHKNICLVLDNEQNEFNTLCSSWPFRYWILNSDNTLRAKMMIKNVDDVDLDALNGFLLTVKKE